MDSQQLLSFIQVAQELHFGRAASKLGMAQPSLSRLIQSLEEELGVSLFCRSNKWHVELTAAGSVFLPEAIKLVGQFRNAVGLARSASGGEHGHLSVGAISSALGKRAFVDTLSLMHRRYAGVRIEVIDASSVELADQLRERSLDVALLRSSPEMVTDEGLVCEKLYDDMLVLVLPRRHHLASCPSLSVRDLRGERFILVPARTSPAFHNYVCGFCASEGGFTPLVADEMSSSYAALHMVEAGLGVTVVSASYLGLFADRLCYRSFSDFHPFLPVYATYASENASPCLNHFLKILKASLAKSPDMPPQ